VAIHRRFAHPKVAMNRRSPKGGAAGEPAKGRKIGKFVLPSCGKTAPARCNSYRGALMNSDSSEIEELLSRAAAGDAKALAEMLSNEETAKVLGISNKAASNRYVRALERLKEILSVFQGIDPSGKR
jgi:hypothetical protein